MDSYITPACSGCVYMGVGGDKKWDLTTLSNRKKIVYFLNNIKLETCVCKTLCTQLVSRK